MPDGGLSILVSGAISGLGAAASGVASGASLPGILGSVLIQSALGASVAVLGYLARPDKPKSNREVTDNLPTNRQNNLSVPVVFGRARIPGNYLAVGNFHYWGTRLEDNGSRVYLLHAIIGLAEGPLQTAGNFRIENKAKQDYIDELREKKIYPEGLHEDAWFLTKLYAGTKNQALIPMMLDQEPDTNPDGVPQPNGFIDTGGEGNAGSGTEMVPWRDTALLACQLWIGYDVGMPNITADVVGPRMNLRVTGNDNTSSNFGDVPGNCFGYDAFSETHWWVLASTDLTEGTPGIVRRHRGGAHGHQHTSPPYTVTDPIEWGAYLGRHDIVVMQDPNDVSLFHIGYWGITTGSEDWESFRPHEGYANPILAAHLDELHGIWHTVHKDANDVIYVLHWNVLTGVVERMDTDLDGESIEAFYAMIYSADLNAYVFAGGDGTLYLVGPKTGETFLSTTDVSLSGCKGLFATGRMVGVVKATGVQMWDSYDGGEPLQYGGPESTVNVGQFGGTWISAYNTYTGHVSIAKPISGDVCTINFFPSIVEDMEDVSANGTPGQEEFQTFPHSDVRDWCRDWSWRSFDQYDLRRLEGNSSVAAAAWSLLTDVRDSGRWGAGLPSRYFDISSFEALHARCVAPWKYRKRRGAESGLSPDRYWAERFSFSYVLDNPASVSAILTQEILGVCNGHRFMSNGKLAVGVSLPGCFPTWHFTRRELGQDTPTVSFSGRSGVLNRVRVEYVEARRDYRADYAEANDEFDQDRTGRIADQTVTLSGISRPGHAELIARTILDNGLASRRTVEFKTSYLGFVLQPGDRISVSYEPCGLNRLVAQVVEITQGETADVSVKAIEHIEMAESARDSGASEVPTPPGGGGGGTPEDPIDPTCKSLTVSGGGDPAWFGAGASYLAGNYTVLAKSGFATDFEFITRNTSGEITVLGQVGYTITLESEGPIGVRSTTGATSNATFELCVPDDRFCRYRFVCDINCEAGTASNMRLVSKSCGPNQEGDGTWVFSDDNTAVITITLGRPCGNGCPNPLSGSEWPEFPTPEEIEENCPDEPSTGSCSPEYINCPSTTPLMLSGQPDSLSVNPDSVFTGTGTGTPAASHWDGTGIVCGGLPAFDVDYGRNVGGHGSGPGAGTLEDWSSNWPGFNGYIQINLVTTCEYEDVVGYDPETDEPIVGTIPAVSEWQLYAMIENGLGTTRTVSASKPFDANSPTGPTGNYTVTASSGEGGAGVGATISVSA